MKKFIFTAVQVLLLNLSVAAQPGRIITVSSGTRVLDYFPVDVRYRYTDFIDGQIHKKNGTLTPGKFNYNFLLGEMDFIQARDTLSLINKKDLKYITVAQDTFYYDNGFIEQISDGGMIVGAKQYFKLKDVLRKGAFGTTNRASSIESYKPVSKGSYYDWIPNEDCVFQMTAEYYISKQRGSFLPFTRKNVIRMFPQHGNEIKEYFKSNKLNFSEAGDLLMLADFLKGLL